MNGHLDDVAEENAGEKPSANLEADERDMTVEQWIRREVQINADAFQREGEALIAAVKAQAEEAK